MNMTKQHSTHIMEILLTPTEYCRVDFKNTWLMCPLHMEIFR